jgi:phosphoglycerol transferase
MNKSKFLRRIPDYAVYVILQLAFIVCFFLFVYGVNSKNLFLPWVYGGDGLSVYQALQNIQDSGWASSNPRLAAPFTAQNFDYMANLTDNIAIFFFKLFNHFSRNVWFSVNINYILNCIAISLISYFVMVNIKINRIIATSASLTFALFPYFFSRGISHYFLSMYQFIPLGILLCIWVYNEDNFLIIDKHFFKYKKNILALLFCFLIAENGNGYYPFFACFFILITGLIKSEFKINKKLFPAAILIFVIGTFFVFNLIPHFLYIIKNGKNLEAGIRLSWEAELHGFKIAQLFMPLNSHNINILQKIISEYNNGIYIAENRTAYLGLCGSIGCIILFIYLFIKEKENNQGKLMFLLSRLNIAGILLATVGGFSSLFALLISPQLRAYNRISVFIAFICILSTAILLNAALQKISSKDKKELFLCSTTCIMLIGILFQYPRNFNNKLPKDVTAISSFTSDSEFIRFIEDEMPEGAMIYQLPFHRYPESPPKNKFNDYRHFIATLHSKKLKWSYGAMKGRYPDYWHQKVDYYPLDIKLRVLSLVGFEGIYIDRSAYTAEELSSLEQSLAKILNLPCYSSTNQMLSFFSMKNYNTTLRSSYTNEELNIIKEEFLSDIDEGFFWLGEKNVGLSIIPLQQYNNEVVKNESGFFELYKGGILYGPYITLKSSEYTLTVDCDFDDSFGNPALSITANAGKNILKTFPLYKGKNTISFILDEKWDLVEFVIRNDNFPKIEVKSMYFDKKG